MARFESDREDLFAEATAFVRRAELGPRGEGEPVVYGEKRDGGFSIYFGGDPVYHFDESGRLKRAFAGGRLYRTQGATLAELSRERFDTQTVLRRRDLTAVEAEHFLAEVRVRMTSLLFAIDSNERCVLRSLPDEFDPLREIASRIKELLEFDDSEFLAPRFRGKR